MKIPHQYLLSLQVLLATLGFAAGEAKPPASRAAFKVIVQAVDDVGMPVAGADIGFAWGLVGYAKPDADFRRVIADQEGRAVFTGETIFQQYAYGGVKEGYYPTRGVEGAFEISKDGRWQPWEKLIVVVMRPVRKPVPMYARRIEGQLPNQGKWAGYDLMKGDWVSPIGKGERVDVEFLAEGEVVDERNYQGALMARFPGEKNGMLAYDIPKPHGSELRMPYDAPEDGYVSEWKWRDVRRVDREKNLQLENVNDSMPERNYIFRVRAVLDSQGRVISAWYGKIHGPFQSVPGKNGQCWIGFTYYLNTDGTRNLEFDTTHNLFSDQRVTEP